MQPISAELSAKFRHFFTAFEPEASPLQLQSELLQLSEAMVRGLVAGMGDRGGNFDGPPIRGTARMRECLHEEGFDIDLETLARKVGLSRFQALRAFKRRYGLPPHAYQLAVRIGLARRMLSEGAAPVEAAMHCGFVDQSHFSRHFKRAFGVTPLQCARGQGRASGVYLASRAVDSHPDGIVSRSDRHRD
ncbi:MAG: AraC family transcriptional regulator [Myxococcales bacterium]